MAPGVYVVVGDTGRGSEGRPNAGFIVTGDGVVVIDALASPAQGHCTEVMIGVVVRQDQPANGLACDRTDRAHQLLPLRGTGERIDHHDAVAGHDEAGVGSPFRAAA